jgi:asparagine synthase (glutamine-hydrolysing)
MFSKREPISQEALTQATQRLHHRGPDQQRQWIAPHGQVGLGHARLSIIDLLTGDQPIANEACPAAQARDGRLRIIVNGEFYGFERIRREMEQRGHRFCTRADSEIALHLYEELGTQCLHHLRGEFAFVLWDESNKLLFAARDRFGIKPLFYAIEGDTLYLASEVKALFAAGVPARWDHESVFQHLFVCMDQDRTLYEGVLQVPPGHCLLATRRHLQLVRYWDLDYPRDSESVPLRTEAEYIEQLRQALDEAVRLRLRADVPVGCLLSGGVDSSAVLGIAAKHCADPIKVFTVAFQRPVYDESSSARDTAAFAGADFHPIPLKYSDFADHFVEAVWHAEMIGDNAHGIARYLLSRAVRDAGYKVVLTGEGGDELFAGYKFLRQDILLSSSEGREQKALRQSAAPLDNPAARELFGSPLALTCASQVLGFTPSLLKSLSENRSIFRTLLASDFAAEFRERDPYRILLSRLDVQGQLAGRERVLQSLYLWCKSVFVNVILGAERLDMAHAVELRLPFLDHKVFELVREMPVSLLFRRLQEKYVLREAARPFLTDAVYRARKHPFVAPPATLTTNNKLFELMQDVLRSRAMASVPFFDQAAVIALLDKLPAMDNYKRIFLDPILTMMLCICILQERFGLKGGPA